MRGSVPLSLCSIFFLAGGGLCLHSSRKCRKLGFIETSQGFEAWFCCFIQCVMSELLLSKLPSTLMLLILITTNFYQLLIVDHCV